VSRNSNQRGKGGRKGGPRLTGRKLAAWKGGRDIPEAGPVTVRRADGHTEEQPAYTPGQVKRIQAKDRR
jgi:hypothetical protein